jgi:hypothetical protein
MHATLDAALANRPGQGEIVSENDELQLPRRLDRVDLDMAAEGKVVFLAQPNQDRMLLLFVAGQRGFSLAINEHGLARVAEAVDDAMHALQGGAEAEGGLSWLSAASRLRMHYVPPQISHREDGELALYGVCQSVFCDAGECQLAVLPLDRGALRVSFHGAERHSIILTSPQRDALIELLRTTPVNDEQPAQATTAADGIPN